MHLIRQYEYISTIIMFNQRQTQQIQQSLYQRLLFDSKWLKETKYSVIKFQSFAYSYIKKCNSYVVDLTIGMTSFRSVSKRKWRIFHMDKNHLQNHKILVDHLICKFQHPIKTWIHVHTSTHILLYYYYIIIILLYDIKVDNNRVKNGKTLIKNIFHKAQIVLNFFILQFFTNI